MSSQSEKLGAHVTPELLAILDTVFPDRCARKGQSLEDIWIEAGTRKVVDKLRDAFEDYNSIESPVL